MFLYMFFLLFSLVQIFLKNFQHLGTFSNLLDFKLVIIYQIIFQNTVYTECDRSRVEPKSASSVFQIFTVLLNDAFNHKKHSKAFFTIVVPYAYVLFFVPPIRQAQKRYHLADSLTSLQDPSFNHDKHVEVVMCHLVITSSLCLRLS